MNPMGKHEIKTPKLNILCNHFKIVPGLTGGKMSSSVIVSHHSILSVIDVVCVSGFQDRHVGQCSRCQEKIKKSIGM